MTAWSVHDCLRRAKALKSQTLWHEAQFMEDKKWDLPNWSMEHHVLLVQDRCQDLGLQLCSIPTPVFACGQTLGVRHTEYIVHVN